MTIPFDEQCKLNAARMAASQDINDLTMDWICKTALYKYTYNFKWLGRPIIQFPQDMFAMQEIIWNIRPDLIVETGIAHGGSLIFYASMMELIGDNGVVVGIDVDIRKHNRTEIEKHRMFRRISMIEGSSVDGAVIKEVYRLAEGKRKVLVALDSNHTHEHVFKELQEYSPLVKKGSYIVVFDTIIETMPIDSFPDRPWNKGNNPMTAVHEFLKSTDRFVVDKETENKLLITVAPTGYLKCIKD
jgi:cephalosporin hydroxylase